MWYRLSGGNDCRRMSSRESGLHWYSMQVDLRHWAVLFWVLLFAAVSAALASREADWSIYDATSKVSMAALCPHGRQYKANVVMSVYIWLSCESKPMLPHSRSLTPSLTKSTTVTKHKQYTAQVKSQVKLLHICSILFVSLFNSDCCAQPMECPYWVSCPTVLRFNI